MTRLNDEELARNKFALCVTMILIKFQFVDRLNKHLKWIQMQTHCTNCTHELMVMLTSINTHFIRIFYGLLIRLFGKCRYSCYQQTMLPRRPSEQKAFNSDPMIKQFLFLINELFSVLRMCRKDVCCFDAKY